jgi:hypothetical protein
MTARRFVNWCKKQFGTGENRENRGEKLLFKFNKEIRGQKTRGQKSEIRIRGSLPLLTSDF